MRVVMSVEVGAEDKTGTDADKCMLMSTALYDFALTLERSLEASPGMVYSSMMACYLGFMQEQQASESNILFNMTLAVKTAPDFSRAYREAIVRMQDRLETGHQVEGKDPVSIARVKAKITETFELGEKGEKQ